MEHQNINPTTENMGSSKSTVRGAFWASVAFYALIAFEFFYMFSPFAAYFYSVYGPGLEVLNWSGTTSWLISFFMPHIVRNTQSFLVNIHEVAGGVLFSAGMIGFIIGAAQIYWGKLTRKESEVSGGIYRWIRHPQYLALMLAGFGMVLLWPRYLVLFGFVTVCFAYYLLARTEEKVCVQKYPGYKAYADNTGMFLPQKIEQIFSGIPVPKNKIGKIFGGITMYSLLLLCAFGAARFIHQSTVQSLYSYATQHEVYLSLGRLASDEIAGLAEVVASDEKVQARLSPHRNTNSRFINYVMPAELYVSEVPMMIPAGEVPTHEFPADKDQSRYKIIFTEVQFGPGGPADGLQILVQAINKRPVLEVWIDRNINGVTKILDPPGDPFYQGMPVPVY